MLVAGLHLLFLLVFAGGRRPAAAGREPQAMVLVYLPPAVEVRPAQHPRAPRTVSKRGDAAPAPPQPAEPAAAAITPEPPRPSIDWRTEARITAQAQAVEGIRRQQRECEEARQHGKYPLGCPKDSYDPHWKPQEKTVGFVGVLPYVRVGKRCVLVLGFFACNLDAELPKPDGTLLKDMPDVSRPVGSVPQLGSAFPEAPTPQVSKPQ